MHMQRIPYLDTARATQALALSQDMIAKSRQRIEDDPTRLVQTRQSGLAGMWESVGLFYYALGYSLADVCLAFCRSAEANQKVFELRGTDPPFPVTVVEIEPRGPGQSTGRIVRETPLHPPGTIDYSLTNSRYGLRATYVALVAHDFNRAQTISSLLWDPPDASYLAVNSVVCTPTDMHLAYAFRELLGGNGQAALGFLDKVAPGGRKHAEIRAQAKMIRALVALDSGVFLHALTELLEWHQQIADENRASPRYYLCIPGLALTILALKNQLLVPDQLPGGNPFFPRELVSEGTFPVTLADTARKIGDAVGERDDP
jgi:hypothetical protein